MTTQIQSPYTSEQISVWLRGLLTLAWSDGNFDVEEQKLITALTHQQLTATDSPNALEPISPAELAAVFGKDSSLAENFLRTAVMVAVADGAYSLCEDKLLHEYCEALGLSAEILQALRSTLFDPETQQPADASTAQSVNLYGETGQPLDVLHPVKDWLDQMEIHDPKVAHFLCKLIPPQCPFERDINLFGRRVAHIPPLCKLNPLYEQLVSLRFRALSYLADECQEDISSYC
ncbi:nitrogenase [Kovacikia minuta CCNUW1]|uniref:Mo-dependent nitrogenase C-terminal domain-containing protein n=1 Tax=Kovacikia minuta TaxID=2931930 RepID=UPI001CCF8699|nr:Mo-dependent nitrogenase C-terminal domain-containing protein [Kovacikia minuta]UBF29136.1 nitrogenase [Kovacikia minuta CCNUW1]